MSLKDDAPHSPSDRDSQTSPSFCDACRSGVALLAARARYRRYSQNELLFSKGTVAGVYTWWPTGSIRIFKVSTDGPGTRAFGRWSGAIGG